MCKDTLRVLEMKRILVNRLSSVVYKKPVGMVQVTN